VILIAALGAGASADLVIHWGLDESSGTTAHDSVGDNHGRLIGNTVWVPGGGKFGGAARFDGADDSVRLTAPASPFPVSGYPFTLMGWCKTTKSTAKAVIVAVVQGTSYYYWVGVQNGRGCITARITSRQYEQMGGSNIANDQWHHVCGVYDGPESRRLYVNGVEVTQDTRTIEFLPGIRQVAAGALDRDPAGQNIVDEMLGAVDDVAIFDEALDVATINHFMANGVSTTSRTASAPSPADGATDVPRDIALGWAVGESARAHDVYLGSVLAEVETAGRTNAPALLVSQAQDANSYAPAIPLEFGKTYYWRVDEIDAPPETTIHKGKIWSFTVEPFAYTIRDITATASSAQPGMGPEKTIDGSGLDKSGLHGTEPTTMWLSAATPLNWVQYEFDKVYKLHELQIWNSNQLVESIFGMGAKKVTVEYSTDGTTWTALANVPEFARAPGTTGYAANTTVSLSGVMAKYVRLTIDAPWGGMGVAGLSEVRFTYIPVQARAPQPAHDATGVSVDTDLNWRPGREAGSHAVYFGADPNALGAARTVTGHSLNAGTLNLGTRYYWRVDEVNTVTYPGELWSFSTVEYAVVDDFESYTNDEGSRIYEAWIDGYTNGLSGSIVGHIDAPFAEQTIIHGGRQSMPLEYNNVKTPFYSETERTFDTSQDWTANGADTLSLYFRGNPVAFLENPDGTIVMGGGGVDIWGTADQFRFAYRQLSGDGSLVARVDSLVRADAWTKVGVMIRENLEAGSRHAAVVVTPGNGVSFLQRTSSNTASQQINQTGLTAPYWVKLTRTGNTFTAQRSADGVAWVNITNDPAASSVDVLMGSNAYIGLAVTSHSANMQTSAVFSNVATTGNVTGQWQDLAIGAIQPGNDPAPLYVVVEDQAGHKQTVVHADPAAVTALTWQQWRIPLGDFSSAGVNLAAVKKLILGVGDRANPKPGPTGSLFIDDIGVGHPAP
jgi:regulation of enolase protein 1 (concanavalin A-like superfamily)